MTSTATRLMTMVSVLPFVSVSRQPVTRKQRRQRRQGQKTAWATRKKNPLKNRAKPRSGQRWREKRQQSCFVVLLVLLLLVFGSAAALILLPEEYTAFVPDSVRTSVEEAPEAISSFFVSIPGQVSALWGGEPTTPVTDATDTPADTADTATTDTTTDATADAGGEGDSEGDGGEIIAVPSFDEDTTQLTRQPPQPPTLPIHLLPLKIAAALLSKSRPSASSQQPAAAPPKKSTPSPKQALTSTFAMTLDKRL